MTPSPPKLLDQRRNLVPDSRHKGERRSAWVDNIRTAVVVLVVNLHSCVTYSHVGDWYLKDGPEGSLSEKLPYIFWIFHLQSFFMGLLFFLAGAFADRAIRRHGPGLFLRERLFRLGAPALLYMAVLQPIIVFGLLGAKPITDAYSLISIYKQYLTSGQVLGGSGPMWFALALLGFCALLAVWRTLITDGSHTTTERAPQTGVLLSFALTLVLVTAIVRGVFPVGTSFFNFQVCYFPQYIAAFVVGVAAGRGDWLESLAATRRARYAGYMALLGGPLSLALLLLLGGGPAEGPNPGEHGPILYFGGWNPQAFGGAAWEQLTGVGLALGMMALFHRVFNHAGAVARWLSARSFAVYVLHAPLLIALTLLFRSIHVDPLSHVLLLTLSTLVVSFAVAEIAKRTPFLRSVL
jgi:glucans biosynthesis protein C